MSALQVGLRALDAADSRHWLSRFSTDASRARLTVLGAGVIGDPASVPWLITKMRLPALARLAGESFSMITGVDLAYQDLDQDAPAQEEQSGAAEESIGYESNLPWPSPGLVAKWWERNQNGFVSGTRYLAGQPISAQSALAVLVKGTQRQRAAAALELALLEPTNVLWEVRAPGRRQHARLERATRSG